MTRRWQAVVDAITSGAPVETVAALSAQAAAAAFDQAKKDPHFLHILRVFAELPLAARTADYLDDLRALGLALDSAPSFLELTSALAEGLDRRGEGKHKRSDVGELAKRALLASLTSVVAPGLPGLFGDDPYDLQRELGRHAGGARFGRLGREFFARFTEGVLGYYLSRELAEHQGAGRRFAGEAERSSFEDALSLHCWEASRIVEDYAGGWFGKHVYQGDGLTPDIIARFGSYSLTKIRSELRRREDA